MHRFDEYRAIILATRTEGALMEVMREFCSLWPAEDLARLPAECRPLRVSSADDIHGLALTLLSCDLRSTDAEISPTLRVLAQGFVLATEQLRRIRPSPFDVGKQPGTRT